MHEELEIILNGRPYVVHAGTTVAAAMMLAGEPCRLSVTGTPRAPLCGMGICFECRMIVNGDLHRRTCQMLCENGMSVETAR